MALTAKQAGTLDTDFPVEGNHAARVIGLVDLGYQPGYNYRGQEIAPAWKQEWVYELVLSKREDGTNHTVNEEIKSNNFEKNGKMSNMMARVRSIDIENDTNNGKDLIKLLGKPAMVTVTFNKNGWPEVKGQAAVSRVPLGMQVEEPTKEVFSFDLDNPNMEIWSGFSERLKNKIKSALNYKDTKLFEILSQQQEDQDSDEY